MKKLLVLLSMLLVFSLVLAPLGYAAGTNTDTLADWNIKIIVPDDTTAMLKGNEYYIYAQSVGAIPYVRLIAVPYDSPEDYIEGLTPHMQAQYADLKVTAEAEKKTVGDKECYEIDYGYKVSGYDVTDRRLIMTVDGMTYMFTSKEVPALDLTLGSMLEDVVADCEFLSAPSAVPEVTDGEELADAYLYCQKDGMPKYWLDLSGILMDTLALHCYFRSSDPTFYEQVYFLDLSTADVKGDTITIHDVYDAYGFSYSDWFKSLTIRLDADGAMMTVKRDEKTLAGGSEDNILTGKYAMEPVGVGVVYEYHEDSGQLKYWLDTLDDQLQLHAMFISGEPEYYEKVFTLDTDTAKRTGDYTLSFGKVYTETGEDVSRWFKSLTLTEVEGAFLMQVEREEKTLAGGAGDNILTGTYLLEPHTYLLPLEEGPYTEEELARWSQIYYFRHHGFFPPVADVEAKDDGTFSVHLYEIVKQDDWTHTATSAWYTRDANGAGTDEIFESEIRLYG